MSVICTWLPETSITASSAAVPLFARGLHAETAQPKAPANVHDPVNVTLNVNGREQHLQLDPRASLLDTLREEIGLTGTKKGCDHGQCGACTVLIDDRRVLSCLTLAATASRSKITTIEGLANGDELHPVQAAFIKHDAFQCGYCTPGQICSAVGVLEEVRRGWPSHVSEDLTAAPELTDAEVSERMSGNLCRCGAYANITPAVQQAGGVLR